MEDAWIVKTDQSGVVQWQKCYGGSQTDIAYSVCQSSDGPFMVVGSTFSLDGDVTYNHGGEDYWLLRLCYNDPLAISVSDTVYCYTTNLTATPGFASYLWSTGDTTQTIAVDTGGVYSVTALKFWYCPSESSITIPNPVQPFSGEKICMVTLDSISGKNIILINKTMNVGTDSIYFIHTLGDIIPGSIFIKDNLYWGGDFDSLKLQIKLGMVNPHQVRFFLGYSGWEAGQLEEEIKENSWLVADIPQADLMNIDENVMWVQSVRAMGGKYIMWENFPENPSLN